MAGFRINRVSEDIKREITAILRELKDPRVMGKMLTVVRVEVSSDASYAKVYVSILNAKSVKADLAILKKSSGLTRSLLAKRMNLRITPEIIFELDDSMEYGARIDSILKDIMKDINKN